MPRRSQMSWGCAGVSVVLSVPKGFAPRHSHNQRIFRVYALTRGVWKVWVKAFYMGWKTQAPYLLLGIASILSPMTM